MWQTKEILNDEVHRELLFNRCILEYRYTDAEGEIDNLYETVAALPEIDKPNVLVITGLGQSLVPYIKPGYGSEGDYYVKDTVPKILGKLNLQREKFREMLKLCLVFPPNSPNQILKSQLRPNLLPE